MWDSNESEKLDNFYKAIKALPERVPIETIDVETKLGVELSIKYGVKNIPTIVYTQNGKEIDRDSGNSAYTRIQYHF